MPRWSPRLLRIAKVGIPLVVLANVLGFALVHAVFPRISWDPQFGDAPVAAAEPSSSPSAFAVAGVLPAQRVVDRVMRTQPAPLRRGWRATSEDRTIPALPAAFACGTEGGPGPVLSEARGWVQATGPLPSDVTSSVQVAARAYSAGAAGYAVRQIERKARSCDATTVADAPRLGVQSTVVTTDDAATLVWRRGDVLVVGSVRGATIGDLQPVWRAFDRSLVAALRGVCADPDSIAGDYRRSPLADRQGFTGRTKGSFVPAPETTPSPMPEPEPGAPRPSEIPIPAPEIEVPALRTIPTPSAPITPRAMPEPVPSPASPSAPVKPPDQVRVGLRVPDETGPGCGWAFTGQEEPAYDLAKARTDFEADREATRERLLREWRQWQGDRVRYFAEHAAYAQRMGAYAAYVARANAVTDQWSAVMARRYAYIDALEAWRQAKRDRASFERRQERAAERYREGLRECRRGPVRQRPDCPDRPRILDQQPPRVPPQPAAPDASFPEWDNPGRRTRN